ncbi:MAG: TSCPD domain-containing protein, partial [Coriobacteriales bacterium]|nr:TSCPD domain-containing protein [Coriobacteriales bacterium]
KQYDYEVDWEKLAQTVADAVHFLDNVIEINDYPLAAIAEATLKTRKIGLGVMGFADMLLKLGLPYASEEALNLAERVMAFISTAGRQASQQLADKRGAFPLFGESNYAQAGIEPLRNATVTTIAPTGTLSIIAGCSSGVEPVFAYVFIRRIMDGQEFVEVNPALHKRLEKAGIASEELMRKIAEAGSITDIEEIPVEIRRIFLCAHDISPEYHIRMQAAFQRHTDNAVSKTVNFTATASTEDIAEVFRLAYREGCKGVTIYRDGSRESQVLSIKGRSPGETDAGTEPVSPVVIQTDALLQNFGEIRPRPRPVVTSGFTERMKTGCGNLYITVNFDENGICEVFTSTGKAGGCPSQSEAAARLTSIALRSGISVEEVCAQLKGIRCPSTIRQDNMSCTSCPDAIAKVVLKVHRHIKSGGPLTANAIPPTPLLKRSDHRGAEVNGQRSENDSIKAAASEATITTPVNQASLALPGQIEAFCPDCSMRLEHEGGCAICRNCGYSKCR